MKHATGAGIVLWCVTVAAAVGVGWGAIELVGDDVGPGPSVAAPITASTTPAPTITPSAKPTPKPSSRPTSSVTRTATPAPTSRATTAPPAVATVKTWTGAAGSVRVSCTRGVIKLVGATPADGWRVERAESDSDVEVRFERAESEVDVKARCGASGPVFSVESDKDDESED